MPTIGNEDVSRSTFSFYTGSLLIVFIGLKTHTYALALLQRKIWHLLKLTYKIKHSIWGEQLPLASMRHVVFVHVQVAFVRQVFICDASRSLSYAYCKPCFSAIVNYTCTFEQKGTKKFTFHLSIKQLIPLHSRNTKFL